MDNTSSEEYMYSLEDLKHIIESLNKGITPMVPSDMIEEAKRLQKELIGEEEDDDDYSVEDMGLVMNKKLQQKKIEAALEKEKRRAHTEEFTTLTITPEKRKKLMELTSGSYVRKLPKHAYHQPNSERYDSEERQEIMKRMNRVTNIYSNVDDWKNAIKILLDALQYSYDHDYPGIPEGMKKGIHLSRPIPKLIVNGKLISDKETLMKIYNGDIVYEKKKKVDKSERKFNPKTDPSIPFSEIGHVMTPEEVQLEIDKAKAGDTRSIVYAMNKVNNSIYHRYFVSQSTESQWDKMMKGTDGGYNRTWDFTEKGSGEAYWNYINGKHKNPWNDLVNEIKRANNNQITDVINADRFREQISRLSGTALNKNEYSVESWVSTQLNPSQNQIQYEESILEAMRRNNPQY